MTVGMVKHCLTNNHVGIKFTGPKVRQKTTFLTTSLTLRPGYHWDTTGGLQVLCTEVLLSAGTTTAGVLHA